MKDCYSILKISRSASSVEIEAAYRSLSKQYHPDVNKGQNASVIFMEIKEAYEVLFDDARRIHYNQLLDYTFQKQNKQINSTPRISVFYCDNAEFSIGDVVTFTWEVTDADVVELRPFGKVANSGTKKIRITDVSTNLLVELFCFNSLSKNYVFSQIILKKRENFQNQNTIRYEDTTSDSFERDDFSNPNKITDSKKIKIFNYAINRPDGLELFIWIYTIINLFIYFSYPLLFIRETQVEAIRAFSNTENGFTDYFIEFENFIFNSTQQMAENLQAMDERIVVFGTSIITNELAYYSIPTHQNSIKEVVFGYNNVGNFAIFYYVILLLQFYFTFIREKKQADDKSGYILGFFFVFSLAMSYVLYSNLF